MSLKNLKLKHSYSTDNDDLITDFYIPVLKEAILYKRITGYFSSNSFRVTSEGLSQFLLNEGKMQFILNVFLSEDDYRAIEKGLSKPEDLISSIMLSDLKKMESEIQQNHLKILAWMISQKILEIKVAYRESNSSRHIMHQKVGIFFDSEGNILSFSGSNNESAQGWLLNSEEFKVFLSPFGNPIDQYVQSDMKKFDELWNNSHFNTKVISFPEAVKKEIIVKSPRNKDELNELMKVVNEKKPKDSGVRLRKYQIEAIEAWNNNNKIGLLEMATGTGKTLTALSAMQKLMNEEPKLIVIICCPYLHLINQWVQNYEKMKFSCPICHVSSIEPKWREKLANHILNLKIGLTNQLVIFISHGLASHQDFLSYITEIKRVPIFFIGDEVHGMGSTNHLNGLNPQYKFRLGLSATPDRYFDEVGTETLCEYFGKTVYSFDLSRAINEINPETGESYLCPYEYHPLFTELTEEEMNEYGELSSKIIILSSKKEKNKDERNRLEKLLRDRADILKNAIGKYSIFFELAEKLKINEDFSHTLIYTSPQQIEKIQQILNTIRDIIQHKFTSEEDAVKCDPKYNNMTHRDFLLHNFDIGKYDILVAMKCLDEGVDIPSTRNAIILCSTGNPKEYIQRRGRVLRRYPGKEKAVIYDITALPNFIHCSSNNLEKTMLNSQLTRLEEFSNDALNKSEIKREIFNIKQKYGL